MEIKCFTPYKYVGPGSCDAPDITWVAEVHFLDDLGDGVHLGAITHAIAGRCISRFRDGDSTVIYSSQLEPLSPDLKKRLIR